MHKPTDDTSNPGVGATPADPAAQQKAQHQAIAADVDLGERVRLASFVNLYGCRVGDDTTVGAFVEIQRGASVGARCKISSHSFVCEGVTIDDECFVGHGVTFINDRYPRSTTTEGRVQAGGDWDLVPTRVGKRASIGSGATILCGVSIGEAAMVGAGALVTKDVPAGQLAVGSPATVVGPAPDGQRRAAGQPRAAASDRAARSSSEALATQGVPFVDLTAQHRPIRGEILAAWSRILDSGAFVSGSEVRGFEEEFAQACGVARCVAVSSGTDALTLALRALGLQAGDAVILPTNTFIATAEAVSNAGGVPVLVDCQESSANIDPRQVPEAVTDRVRGVIGVHLYGQPVDFQALNDVAANRGLWTLEDAAQAHLARCRGRTVGGLGTAAAFSFYPAKNLGAPGEAGAVTTDDAALADEVRMLRDHGQRGKYHSELIGYNARMSELVAAALRIKLPLLPEWTEARRRVAARYRERLADHPAIALPAEPEWSRAVYHLFVVGVPERDRVKAELEAAGIGVGLHYPVPVHLQAAYRGLGYRAGDFPRSERNARSLLSLPMFAELTVDQVDHVCDTLRRAVDAGPAGEVARG